MASQRDFANSDAAVGKWVGTGRSFSPERSQRQSRYLTFYPSSRVQTVRSSERILRHVHPLDKSRSSTFFIQQPIAISPAT